MKRGETNDRLKEFAEHMNFVHGDTQPIFCKKFGCGKVLTVNEQFYGDHCTHHQIEYNQLEKQKRKSELNENNGFPL